MNRHDMLARLDETRDVWDVLVVGGGATGVGVAVDAASRGYRTLLLEQHDFGKGTSSRSTKLVHGGVRYLQQGNVSLVMEALKERGILRRNAPHLVKDLRFIVPNYDWWEAPWYGIGLKIYDMLAGKYGFGPSKMLSAERTIEAIPTIRRDGLRGGVQYFDGQFDDARLLINLVATAAAQGATLCNYVKVVRLLKGADGFASGVVAQDQLGAGEWSLRAKVVVNATGPFSDAVRRMDDAEAPNHIAPSQGVHIVLPQRFLPTDSAIMVPHTADGRVMFAIPWHGHAVVGTTDTPVDRVELEPRPLDEEIDFILDTASPYLAQPPMRSDILSAFAGIRPLVKAASSSGGTAGLSRDHSITIAESGLLTICGGKWTTYRKMAEDCVNHAATIGQLDERPCVTEHLNIHGHHANAGQFEALSLYGADAPAIRELARRDAALATRLHPLLAYTKAEVVWACEHEMAQTVEDVLARRTRSLLLNAGAAVEAAADVASLMAETLGRDATWQREQVEAFKQTAAGYVVKPAR